MESSSRDIENGYDKVELDSESSAPLLPKSSAKSVRRLRRSLEVIELDDIPPIIKSCNGNVFWADEQCTRRVGLTSSEARLFLKLLNVEETEDFNYADYKSMFDSFGEEQKLLEGLVRKLPWWTLDSWRQRAIWEARIEFLQRMDEPRLVLLYLMARRKRILQKATKKILERFAEHSRAKHAGDSPTRGRDPPAGRQELQSPVMLNDTTQTSETNLAITKTTVTTTNSRPVMASEAAQTSDTLLTFTSKVRESLSISAHRKSHSRPTTSHCPIFDKRFEATRADIRRQVESIMPKPRPYIVIGWFSRSAQHPEERTLQFNSPEMFFQALRNGEVSVRGWRRFMSLKGLRGFGLYKCDISRGAHVPLVLNASQEAVLSQLYLAYTASKRHADPDVARAWYGWVQKNLNDNKDNPLEGRYSLQLDYEWSSYRLSSVVAVPMLLSLAIGFWYMNGEGDVVTAWTLALYVITAAALLIALMTVVGGLKDL